MVVGVVFDVDGTLVTFKFDVRGTRKALIDELARWGLDTADLDLTTPTQRILDSAQRQSAAGRGPGFDELRRSVFTILDGFEVASSATTTLLPGVRQALDSLRSKGVRAAVLTNSGRRAATAALTRAGILDCFEFVLTRDDTQIMKPRPEGLQMAMSRLGLPRESVCYVGDSAYDIHAAKAAGVRVIAVATGTYDAERLRAEGADQVIGGLSELPAILST